jgi:hypothetical protein
MHYGKYGSTFLNVNQSVSKNIYYFFYYILKHLTLKYIYKNLYFIFLHNFIFLSQAILLKQYKLSIQMY